MAKVNVACTFTLAAIYFGLSELNTKNRSLDLSVTVLRTAHQPIIFNLLNNGPLLPNVIDSQSKSRKIT